MLSPPAVAIHKSGFGSLVVFTLGSDADGKVVTWVRLVESGASGALWVGKGVDVGACESAGEDELCEDVMHDVWLWVGGSADVVALVVSGDDEVPQLGALRSVKEGSGPDWERNDVEDVVGGELPFDIAGGSCYGFECLSRSSEGRQRELLNSGR